MSPASSVASLTPLFRPRSVAIIGASDDPARISGRPIHYMLQAGFKGTLLPINPGRTTVQGLPAFRALEEVPETPDVVLVAVPAQHTLGALRTCVDRGVKAAVVFSAGYAEMGDEGVALQQEITAIACTSGMRILGPNCLGVYNSASGFYATFSSSLDKGFPTPGSIAVASQSGAYGNHIAYLAKARGMGVRYCITTGNEADVDVAEALHWLALDPDVKVIMAYAEGTRHGDRLQEALRAAHEARKPVVFLKVGRSAAGARAASSHTAALVGADRVYDAVFDAYGVHRATTTDEQLDIAYACSFGVFPERNTLGIITLSGGAGVQICDAAEREGLDVRPMPEAAQKTLKAILPYAAVGNPVDATAQSLNDMSLLQRNFEVMLDQGDYHTVIGFFTTTANARPFAGPLRDAIAAATRNHRQRLIVLSMLVDPDIARSYEAAGFPVFEDMDRAVAAVGALCRLRAAFDRPLPAAVALPAPTLTAGTPALSEHQAKRLLAAAGVPVLPEHLAASADDAVAAAAGLGFPVAMKIVSAQIAHKTEIGGVLLDVADADAVRAGYATLLERARRAVPHAVVDGVLVSAMAGKGVETIIGVTRDPVFGPVVMFGLGGVLVEVLQDVTVRLAPLDRDAARAMIRSVKGHVLLEGVRGSAPADIEVLVDALVAVSRFAAAHADAIESIDINPFLVRPRGQGAVALDALIVPRAG